MNDQELLTLAAKAAGIAILRCRLDDPLQRDMLVNNSARNAHHETGPWNPLTDDGDALRLAVQLGLSVEIHRDNAQPLPWLRVVDREGNWTYCGPQDYHGDELMQTRRAIVNAAAKTLPLNASSSGAAEPSPAAKGCAEPAGKETQ